MNYVNYYSIPGIKRESKPTPFKKTEENIISLVCEITGYTKEQLTTAGYRGSNKITSARFMLCHFLFKYLNYNKTEVGKVVNKDHTTIIWALKKFDGYYKTEISFQDTVDKITSIIES